MLTDDEFEAYYKEIICGSDGGYCSVKTPARVRDLKKEHPNWSRGRCLQKITVESLVQRAVEVNMPPAHLQYLIDDIYDKNSRIMKKLSNRLESDLSERSYGQGKDNGHIMSCVVPQETHERFINKAKKRRVGLSVLLREAIDDYVKKEAV